jgi:hypothetical protein
MLSTLFTSMGCGPVAGTVLDVFVAALRFGGGVGKGGELTFSAPANRAGHRTKSRHSLRDQSGDFAAPPHDGYEPEADPCKY